MSLFPSLDGFKPTRNTLHLYANAMGVLPRAHAAAHDKWWHISLRVTPHGLKTVPFSLPGGDSAWLEMDLHHHLIAFQTGYGGTWAFSLRDGLTGTEMGDSLLEVAAKLGLEGKYARSKFEDDEPRTYDPGKAANYLTALTTVNRIFQEHRAGLSGQMGPIQQWPHGFDLAFEWFGTRTAGYEEDGEKKEISSQLNLGFYPGGTPYFYSNPWPFEEAQLLDKPLLDGARWHTEGWQGAMLPYSELVGVSDAETRLRTFARVVYDLAAPTLTA